MDYPALNIAAHHPSRATPKLEYTYIAENAANLEDEYSTKSTPKFIDCHLNHCLPIKFNVSLGNGKLNNISLPRLETIEVYKTLSNNYVRKS